MTGTAPRHAMVLAAGLGLRMRPITETRPKPLVTVAGRTLLDRALDALADAGVTDATVNVHYLPQMIEDHLASRTVPRIAISDERETLLETGGGVARALPLLGPDAFFVVNADIAWRDGGTPALNRLFEAWDDTAMDALLLLHPVADATGYDGAGDFFVDAGGRLTRRREAPEAPLVFTGVQLLHPRLFACTPDGPFPLTCLYDRAETERRLFGLVHDGDWHHIGTPEGLAEAEARLESTRGLPG
jgi:MurNAc alpha-1-phosphate uridylyltransferase